MAKKEPAEAWPLPDPGVGRVTPAEPDAAPSKPGTPSQGGSYTQDDASGEYTLIERTQETTKE